jgi:hypothetical protein
VLAVFLAWKCPDFRDNSRLGKGTIPEKSSLGTRTLNHFKYSGLGKGNFLENYCLGTGTHNKFSKIPGELPAIAKSLFSPQKEIAFPVRRSLITDIRAGARNSPFLFVSVCITTG